MIGPNSYRNYRYATKKIGWTLAAQIAQEADRIPYPSVTINDLYENELRMQAAYEMDPKEIRDPLVYNLLTRNLYHSGGDRHTQLVRFFHQEIEEVCRKMLSELTAMKMAARLGITAEEAGVEAGSWAGWLEGRVSIPEINLDCLVIASEFDTRETFLKTYARCMYIFAQHQQYVLLGDKAGSWSRLGGGRIFLT